MTLSPKGLLHSRLMAHFICWPPFPAWAGHDFAFCFEDLLFGCATNLVTILMVCFYSSRASAASKKKVEKALQFFGISRSLWVAVLPATGILVTVLQGFQVVFYTKEKQMDPKGHTLLSLCFDGFAWVISWWVLHSEYGAVMVNYYYLRFWWAIRPIFRVPYLYTVSRQTQVSWAPELVEELFSLIVSCIFGLSVFVTGLKVSSMIQSTNREFPLLTKPLLDSKRLHYSTSPTGYSLWGSSFFTWVTPLMDLGTTRQLEYNDLFTLPEKLDPKICSRLLFRIWDEEQKFKEQNCSLFHALYLVYRWQYLFIGMVKVINDTLGFAGPLLLHAIVGSMENGKRCNVLCLSILNDKEILVTAFETGTQN